MRFFTTIAVLLLHQPTAAFIPPITSRYHYYASRRKNNSRKSCNSVRSLHVDAFRLTTSRLYNAEAVDDTSREEQQTKTTFLSPKFQVYIEDTDAYGVMYNSNYVRAFERALLRYAPLDSIREDNKSTLDSKKWILSSIRNQKFRSSPTLGEQYMIRGELVESANDGCMQTWELELITKNDSDDVVHNSACVTMTSGDHSSSLQVLTLDQNCKIDEKIYTPFHDEFDHHILNNNSSDHNYYIPIRNAMNFFERSRSDALGGPDSLRKMQVEDDLIWVVTGVENGRLFFGDDCWQHENFISDVSVDDYLPEDAMRHISAGTIDKSSFSVSPGKDVMVKTVFDVKRRGMILDCHHTLWMKSAEQKQLLAQATCIIVALKGSTRRPTSKLPQYVLDIFKE